MDVGGSLTEELWVKVGVWKIPRVLSLFRLIRPELCVALAFLLVPQLISVVWCTRPSQALGHRMWWRQSRLHEPHPLGPVGTAAFSFSRVPLAVESSASCVDLSGGGNPTTLAFCLSRLGRGKKLFSTCSFVTKCPVILKTSPVPTYFTIFFFKKVDFHEDCETPFTCLLPPPAHPYSLPFTLP